MKRCSFRLNGEPLSQFLVGASAFPAFSGLDGYINKPSHMCVPSVGAVPLGRYYIVDRESGGRLRWLRDLVKGDWFALYAIDSKIDDETFCNGVKRGNFRLHPKAGRGISEGCITLDKPSDFNIVRSLLLGTATAFIPGTETKTYGTVDVRQ